MVRHYPVDGCQSCGVEEVVLDVCHVVEAVAIFEVSSSPCVRVSGGQVSQLFNEKWSVVELPNPEPLEVIRFQVSGRKGSDRRQKAAVRPWARNGSGWSGVRVAHDSGAVGVYERSTNRAAVVLREAGVETFSSKGHGHRSSC